MITTFRTRDAALIAECDGKNLTYAYPPIDEASSSIVFGSLKRDNLKPATLAETVSLIHVCLQNRKNKFAISLLNMLKDGFFCSTGLLYTTKGVYIQDNPTIQKGHPVMLEGDLIKKLRAKNHDVRYKSYGFEDNHMSSEELASNSLVTALVGKRGAEKLAEISKHYEGDPYIAVYTGLPGVFESKPQTRLTTISLWDTDIGGVGGIHLNAMIFEPNYEKTRGRGIGIEKK